MRNIRPASGLVASMIMIFLVALAAPAAGKQARLSLSNENIRAEFTEHGLASLVDLRTGFRIPFFGESFSLTVDKKKIDGNSLSLPDIKNEPSRLIFTYSGGKAPLKVIYELKPGWRFLSKQIRLETSPPAGFRVNEVQAFSAKLGLPVREELRLNDGKFGALVRFGRNGIFLLYQNPFMAWTFAGQDVSASYVTDMDWQPDYGSFVTDRFCIGLVELSGNRFPAKSIPEWKYIADYSKALAENALIDMAEVDALVECVRAFLLVRPQKSIRVHVPWCENDYQIDVATAEGWEEYKRIIDRAAELGCNYTLFTPANSEFSSLKENADAWGWENLLWFSLGQKIRKGEWDPAKDPLPASLQKMLDYGKSKGLKFVSYSYPSLAFKQNPEWTKWAGDKVGGTAGTDTGLRSFQDWWVDKLVSFVKRTGAGGFSFDHWWIAYDNATSKYAQWNGCRRILESLRQQVPEVVIDGRQQYMNFGPWTWLAGSYPHPTLTDEQPESFTAFPDLHTDRVSADRQRFAAWKYRVERFCPAEIMPGYIIHQTERTDGNKVMRRDRFRPRDWDVLGWKYSLLSSIATAPFNHVVNFIPARDPEEFRLFSEDDGKWFREWLDWTDRNADVLRYLKPIISQPMIGRVDGTAAFNGGHGYIFLFNPNYRKMQVEFALDGTIGLAKGERFLIRELYPEKGKLIGRARTGFWGYGEKVSLPTEGAQALVLEVEPAPNLLSEPMLFNSPGRVSIQNGRLEAADVGGEAGTERELLILLPRSEKTETLSVNGKDIPFAQDRNILTARVGFGGEPFRACQSVMAYDPNFTGGMIKANFRVPGRILDQLRKRKEDWPVSYTEDDLLATWLGSHRLLLYAQIAEPDEAMAVTMILDGRPLEVKKAYNSIYGHSPKRTFLGFYADISDIKPDTEYTIELTLPALAPGQFQGLFFENIETEYTKEIELTCIIHKPGSIWGEGRDGLAPEVPTWSLRPSEGNRADPDRRYYLIFQPDSANY